MKDKTVTKNICPVCKQPTKIKWVTTTHKFTKKERKQIMDGKK